MKKFFLILMGIITFGTCAIAIESDFKNSLLKVDFQKSGTDSYNIRLFTQKPYAEPVKVIKKTNTSYYILLPETFHSVGVVAPIGDIKNTEVKLFPYAGQDLNNGYTKISIFTTKPVNIKPQLNTSAGSVAPSIDAKKLAQLDSAFATKQSQVKTQTSKAQYDAQQKQIQQRKAQEAAQKAKEAAAQQRVAQQRAAQERAAYEAQQKRIEQQKLAEQKAAQQRAAQQKAQEAQRIAQQQAQQKALEEQQHKAQQAREAARAQAAHEAQQKRIEQQKLAEQKVQQTKEVQEQAVVPKTENNQNTVALDMAQQPLNVDVKASSDDETSNESVVITQDMENNADLEKLVKEEIPVVPSAEESKVSFIEILKDKFSFLKPYYYVIIDNLVLAIASFIAMAGILLLALISLSKKIAMNKNDKSSKYPLNEDIYGSDLSEEIQNNPLLQEGDEIEYSETSEVLDYSEAQSPEFFSNVIEEESVEVQEEENTVYQPTYEPEEIYIEPEVLSSVEIAPSRGFMLIDRQGVKALFGYIGEEVFLIYQFRELISNYDIKFRISEKQEDKIFFIVRVDKFKLLVRVTNSFMKLELII